MSRLEHKLNNPTVVLVVGVLAVAINVLLYFGYFVPRMTPLIAQINPVGTSLLEAISKSGPEAGSDPQAASKPESGSNPEAGRKPELGSNPEASSAASPAAGSVASPAAGSNPAAGGEGGGWGGALGGFLF